MRHTVTPAVLAALLIFASCATTNPSIYPSASKEQTLSQVRKTLSDRGFSCSPEDEDSLVCEADQTYKIVIDYRMSPRRLLFYAIFNNERPCSEQLHQLHDFNVRYLVQIACIEDSLRFSTSTIVPEAGLNGRELEEFLLSWTEEIYEAATRSGFFAEDEDPAGETKEKPTSTGGKQPERVQSPNTTGEEHAPPAMEENTDSDPNKGSQ